MKMPVKGLDLSGTGECAAFNLRRASRAVSQIYDAGLSETGLRSTQFTILIAVAKNQPVSIGRLAELTLMNQTTMTRALALMARDGLIEVPARGPKREKRVTLAPAGERALARALPVWRELQARFTGAFGAREWRDMRRELQRASHIETNFRS